MPLSVHSGFSSMRWIEHITEPQRLLLVWQAPDEKKFRTRLVVGEIFRDGDEFVLRYFRNTPDVEKAMSLSYQGYPAFNIKQDTYRKEVLQAFLRRLPPRSRPDFGDYLKGLRIKPDTQISDFALLGYSEAKLPGDGFSLVDPLDGKVGPSEFLLEIAGYRHHSPPLGPDVIGKQVEIVPEPHNLHDPNALQVFLGSHKLGYINRLQAGAIGTWLKEGRLSASLEKLNGRPGWPRAFIFIEVM